MADFNLKCTLNAINLINKWYDVSNSTKTYNLDATSSVWNLDWRTDFAPFCGTFLFLDILLSYSILINSIKKLSLKNVSTLCINCIKLNMHWCARETNFNWHYCQLNLTPSFTQKQHGLNNVYSLQYGDSMLWLIRFVMNFLTLILELADFFIKGTSIAITPLMCIIQPIISLLRTSDVWNVRKLYFQNKKTFLCHLILLFSFK